MIAAVHNEGLQSTVSALRQQGVIPAITGVLEAQLEQVAAAAHQAALEEVGAYTASSNPDVVPELKDHLSFHLNEIVRLLGGARAGDFDAVREYAKTRARQRFPLEALLHTYRVAHKVLFAWIRDAAIAAAPDTAHVRRVVAAAADFAIEYTDCVSTLATSSYVNHARMLAAAESDQRAALMKTLLQGYDESDSRAAQLLRRAGYLEQRQSYCVVAARSVNPGEMENAARAQRMADAIHDVLAAAPLRTLISVVDNHVIAIVSGTRRLSGWTAPRSLLADQLLPYLRKVGPAALIGLSNDVPSTSHIPRAATEAKLALDFASVAHRVMPYSSVSLRQLLVAHASSGMQSALPPWLDALLEADARARGNLVATLKAYADANMNVLQAAKVLAVHPNTIYARAQKITDITHRNPLSYHDLTELLLAVECR